MLNIIEVPFSYHIQWGPHYPTYVLFDYDGTKHFVRVQRYGKRYIFANGLKDFRRAHDINNGVIIRFFAPAKNTSFYGTYQQASTCNVCCFNQKARVYNQCHPRHSRAQFPFGRSFLPT